jgi:tripartite-type tricarboxylate transporter receptor subunit TctC
MKRRLAVLLCCAAPWAAAQRPEAGYPSRPLRLIVPFSAGSFSDMLCRVLAPEMAVQLGQPITVENIPGAGATLGTARAKAAAPDGYTLVYAGSSAFATNVSLMQLPYDPVKDFRYIGMIGYTNYVLAAHPDAPFADFPALVARAKAAPGELAYASPGNGTSSHLTMEMVTKLVGIRLRHIPYKGSAPGVNDLVAGHVPLMLDPQSTLLPHVRAGKLKALAVTGTQRMRELPDTPTFAELGLKGFEISLGWFGLAVPAGTPDAIVDKLNAALGAAMQRSAPRVAELGVIAAFGSPEAFRHFVESEIPRYRQLIQDSGLKLD